MPSTVEIDKSAMVKYKKYLFLSALIVRRVRGNRKRQMEILLNARLNKNAVLARMMYLTALMSCCRGRSELWRPNPAFTAMLSNTHNKSAKTCYVRCRTVQPEGNTHQGQNDSIPCTGRVLLLDHHLEGSKCFVYQFTTSRPRNGHLECKKNEIVHNYSLNKSWNNHLIRFL